MPHPHARLFCPLRPALSRSTEETVSAQQGGGRRRRLLGSAAGRQSRRLAGGGGWTKYLGQDYGATSGYVSMQVGVLGGAGGKAVAKPWRRAKARHAWAALQPSQELCMSGRQRSMPRAPLMAPRAGSTLVGEGARPARPSLRAAPALVSPKAASPQAWRCEQQQQQQQRLKQQSSG